MHRLLLLLLIMLCYALQPCNATVVSYADTASQPVRLFDQKHVASYQNDREFNYEKTPAKGGGILSILGYLLNGFFEKLNGVHMGAISLYDLLFYGLMIFAAVMIVLQFFKIKVNGLFAPNTTTIIRHQSFSENVHEIDFDKLVQKALDERDYRLATRLYYLKTLKKLSDTGLINWQKNKTNFEYYYELKGEERRKQFYQLTGIFESAWYGNLEITEAAFDENLKAFTGFLQNLRR